MADLGALERTVMDQLWAAGEPLVVRDLVERVNTAEGRPLAYTTVQTVADRLVRKGLLEREASGRAWAYAPTLSPAEHTATLMLEVLEESDDRKAALAHFAQVLDRRDAKNLSTALAAPTPKPAKRARAAKG
ncbi:MAG: BlaI/MecI/CopY family transcriptional regulator [Motilibacteraceae bacterium]